MVGDSTVPKNEKNDIDGGGGAKMKTDGGESK